MPAQYRTESYQVLSPQYHIRERGRDREDRETTAHRPSSVPGMMWRQDKWHTSAIPAFLQLRGRQRYSPRSPWTNSQEDMKQQEQERLNINKAESKNQLLTVVLWLPVYTHTHTLFNRKEYGKQVKIYSTLAKKLAKRSETETVRHIASVLHTLSVGGFSIKSEWTHHCRGKELSSTSMERI